MTHPVASSGNDVSPNRTARRGRIDREDWARILKNLGELPIEIDGGTHLRVWEAILPMADRHSISVYDASCLEREGSSFFSSPSTKI